MITQKTQQFMLETDLFPEHVLPEDYEISIRSYRDAVKFHKQIKGLTTPHIGTIASFCARNVKSSILRSCDKPGMDVEEILDSAYTAMESYLDMHSYNGWLDLVNSLSFANMCYLDDGDEDWETGISYYECINSPQFNMIESHKPDYKGDWEDSFRSYVTAPIETSQDLDDRQADVSSEIFFFDFSLLEG